MCLLLEMKDQSALFPWHSDQETEWFSVSSESDRTHCKDSVYCRTPTQLLEQHANTSCFSGCWSWWIVSCWIKVKWFCDQIVFLSCRQYLARSCLCSAPRSSLYLSTMPDTWQWCQAHCAPSAINKSWRSVSVSEQWTLSRLLCWCWFGWPVLRGRFPGSYQYKVTYRICFSLLTYASALDVKYTDAVGPQNYGSGMYSF